MKDKHRTTRIGSHELSPRSLMMGYGYDPRLSEGSLKPPIFLTSTFVFDSAADSKQFFSFLYASLGIVFVFELDAAGDRWNDCYGIPVPIDSS